jgi:hypothetical protein
LKFMSKSFWGRNGAALRNLKPDTVRHRALALNPPLNFEVLVAAMCVCRVFSPANEPAICELV